MTIDIDRLEEALRDYDMELLGCYDVHPEAYENDVEAPEHRRAFVDHMLKLAHPALLAALATKDAEIARLRSLAGRYTNHVGECEGTDFLDFDELSFRDNGWLSRDDSAELKALDRAAAEAGPLHLTEEEDTL